MKKTLALIILATLFQMQSYALSGIVEENVETIFDTFVKTQGEKKISASLETITKKLDAYLEKSSTKGVKHDMLTYLNHLFCMKRCLVDGILCRDDYYSKKDVLLRETNTMTLEQRRQTLVTEHNKRRLNRGLGMLNRSDILDAIAQEYALKLCEVDRIDHELNGSNLTERYENAGYDYQVGVENLGYGQTTLAELLDQLTTSIGHRENMYLDDVDEIGIGQCGVIWVLNYGAR